MVLDRELIEKKLDILKDFIHQIEQMNLTQTNLVASKDLQQLLSFRL